MFVTICIHYIYIYIFIHEYNDYKCLYGNVCYFYNNISKYAYVLYLVYSLLISHVMLVSR